MSGSDPQILYIIASGDESDRTKVSGNELVVTGASDVNKLLLERVPYQVLLVNRN